MFEQYQSDRYSVYIIVFPDNKKYIGYTGEPVHKRINKGYVHNPELQAARTAQPYKVIELISGITKARAEALESYYINLFDTTNPEKGYNKSKGGYNGFKGCKLTPEHKKKLHKGKYRYYYSRAVINFWIEKPRNEKDEPTTAKRKKFNTRIHRLEKRLNEYERANK